MAVHTQKTPTSLISLWERVSSSEVAAALLYLVVNSGGLSGVKTQSYDSGDKKHFGYWFGDAYCYAFIANTSHLLFYFRKPALDSDSGLEMDILERFPDAKHNPKNEYTVRVETLEQAEAIQAFLDRRHS